MIFISREYYFIRNSYFNFYISDNYCEIFIKLNCVCIWGTIFFLLFHVCVLFTVQASEVRFLYELLLHATPQSGVGGLPLGVSARTVNYIDDDTMPQMSQHGINTRRKHRQLTPISIWDQFTKPIWTFISCQSSKPFLPFSWKGLREGKSHGAYSDKKSSILIIL